MGRAPWGGIVPPGEEGGVGAVSTGLGVLVPALSLTGLMRHPSDLSSPPGLKGLVSL